MNWPTNVTLRHTSLYVTLRDVTYHDDVHIDAIHLKPLHFVKVVKLGGGWRKASTMKCTARHSIRADGFTSVTGVRQAGRETGYDKF
jgi:hypothetical protein